MAKTARKSSWRPTSRSWRPGGYALSQGDPKPTPQTSPREANGKKEFGLAILTALSIAGIHSAVNPSVFTLRSFAARPEARAAAEQGLWIGLGASLLASGAIWYVFDDWLPAVVGAVTGTGLFGIGWWAVHSPPLPTMPPIADQGP